MRGRERSSKNSIHPGASHADKTVFARLTYRVTYRTMLTEIEIRNTINGCKGNSEARVELRDIGERGGGKLMLIVRGGAKRPSAEWYVHHYNQGRRAMKKIGAYPTVKLAEARTIYREQFQPLLLRGESIERAVPREPKDVTLRGLFQAYVEYLRVQGKSWKQAEYALLSLKGAAQAIGADRRPADIRAADITPHLAEIHRRGKIVHANNVRMWISAAFSFGLKSANLYFDASAGTDWGLQFNPAGGIKPNPAASRARERNLSREEFRALWLWLETAAPLNRAAAAMQLMMITGQRPGEILRLAKTNYDPKEGTLEWPVTKNGRPHCIPLPRQARAILDDLAPNEHGLYFARVYNTSEPLRAYSCDRVIANYLDDTGAQHFINRDLRRTFKTLTGAAGLSKDIRDRLQNHIHSDVSSKHYDKWDYIPEKRAAMKVWEEYVDGLLADAA